MGSCIVATWGSQRGSWTDDRIERAISAGPAGQADPIGQTPGVGGHGVSPGAGRRGEPGVPAPAGVPRRPAGGRRWIGGDAGPGQRHRGGVRSGVCTARRSRCAGGTGCRCLAIAASLARDRLPESVQRAGRASRVRGRSVVAAGSGTTRSAWSAVALLARRGGASRRRGPACRRRPGRGAGALARASRACVRRRAATRHGNAAQHGARLGRPRGGPGRPLAQARARALLSPSCRALDRCRWRQPGGAAPSGSGPLGRPGCLRRRAGAAPSQHGALRCRPARAALSDLWRAGHGQIVHGQGAAACVRRAGLAAGRAEQRST